MLKITSQEQKFWKLKKKRRMLKTMKVHVYFTVVRDIVFPVSVLTLKSLWCLNLPSAGSY